MEHAIRWLGNLLIIGPILILAYVYYPIITIYLIPPTITTAPNTGYYITIPKIHAQSPVILDVDPWNEAIYRPALQQGVASALGFATPTTPGPIFLFAHSSDNPWNITRYNTIFFRLPELTTGDKITLTQNGQVFNYEVRSKIEVWPNQTEFLTNPPGKLILQTCVPIGTSLKRLLIFADPI